MQSPVAGWASPPAPLHFGTQTSRARGVLNEAGLAILLLLGVALLPTTPALAQTQPIVSNLGEATFGDLSGGSPSGSPFTTGSRFAGYTLVQAVVRFSHDGRNTNSVTVSIYDASSNLPNARIGTLAGPSTIAAASNYTYTSSAGIALAASTTYYLIIGSSGGTGFSTTQSTNQTTTDGWDIITRIVTFGGSWADVPLGQGALFSLSALYNFGSGTISTQTYAVGTPITDLTLPTAIGGSGNWSYMLEPGPPAGLSFNSSTRVLSGTPTTEMVAASYTYTATDPASTSSTSLNFTIQVLPPDAVRMRLRVFLEGPLQ